MRKKESRAFRLHVLLDTFKTFRLVTANTKRSMSMMGSSSIVWSTIGATSIPLDVDKLVAVEDGDDGAVTASLISTMGRPSFCAEAMFEFRFWQSFFLCPT